MYSPDGTRLAFVSNRTGNGDLYVLNLATGALQRITFDDAAEQLDGWSRDGKYLYFSSTAQDVAGMNDIFRISAEGGMPVAVTADRVRQRVLLGAFARREIARLHGARQHVEPVVAARPQPPRRVRDLAGDLCLRAEIREARRRRFQMPLAHVERRRRARLLS